MPFVQCEHGVFRSVHPTSYFDSLIDSLPAAQTGQSFAPPTSAPTLLSSHQPLSGGIDRNAAFLAACRIYECVAQPSTAGIVHKLDNIEGRPSPTPQNPLREELLPLLITIHRTDNFNIPVLLLLGCVHYSLEEYTTSIRFHEQILAINPECVSDRRC